MPQDEHLNAEEYRDRLEAEGRQVEANKKKVGAEIGEQFLEIKRIIAEIQALPEGAANQGADKVRELHTALAEVNCLMSDLGVTVHLTPVAIEASALTILTGLVSTFFLRVGGCDECPYKERCIALVGFEFNDKACADRLFEWFSHADFPWLYPERS
jgi:hypothetical protein